MADYHLSKKGEDFIDGHYREFQGSGGVSVDRVIQWLWWLRESGDFKANNLKLIEDVGNERAGNVLNWAVHKGYLEEDQEPLEDLPGVDPYLSRSGVPHIRELMVELRKAKARGDEAEYARLLDLSIHPEAPLTNLETCEDCGQQYSPDAPDDWGTHLHQTCNKCHAKNLGRPRGRY